LPPVHCHHHLFTAVTACSLPLLTVSTSAAYASIATSAAICPAPLKAELNGALHSNKDLLPIASAFPPSTAISHSAIHCNVI
jgi:hypothetical protein